MSETPQYTRLDVCVRFVASVRHSTELGIEVLSAEEMKVAARMPWQERLIGNPETGALHGGAVFAFLDQVGGLAVACRTYPTFEITPTIDFRLDHLRAAEPGKSIIGIGECYRFTEHVAFVKVSAFEEGSEDPVAVGLATYTRLKVPARGYFKEKKSA